MAINFPNSPSVNDTHVVADKTWTWNGTYWHLTQNTSNQFAQDGVPSNPVAGDFWFETDTGNFFVRYDGAWVEIGHATDFGTLMSDLDGDTLIQIEESSDEDIIRFDTGGSERMVINASGKVGIGTASPSVPLHVASGSSGATAHSYTGLIVESDESAAISILTPNNMDSYIYFADPEANNVGRISYGHGGNNLSITTNSHERMTIDGSGNVGIGDTSPDSKLHIRNGDIRIDGGTSGDSNKIIFKTVDNTDVSKYICLTDYWMEIGVHDNEGLRVNNSSGTNIFQISGSSGNVGIGTTTPAVKFDCAGLMRCIANDSGWPASGTGLEITYDAGDARAYLQSYDRGASAWKPITISGSSISLTQGNVGIGTSSPTSKFHATDGDVNDNPHFLFEATQSTGTNNGGDLFKIEHGRGAGNTNALLNVLNSVGSVFYVRGDGKVGIGTTAPTCILNVSSSGDPVVRIDETGGSGNVYLQLMQSGSNGEGTQLRYDSSTGHSYLTSIYSGGNLYFQTANSTRMQIHSSGKMVLSMGGDYTPAANIGVQSANGQAHPYGHIVSHSHSTILWGTDNNGHYLGGDTKNFKFKRSCTWNAHPGSAGYVAMEIREGATQHGGTDADYGGIGFAAAGVYIDRNWGNYPGFTVCNSSVASDTNQGEFRLHGANHSYASYPAISGSDFSVVTRSDGGFATGSDERRKENITTISGALATVNSLRGVEFNTIIRDGSQETLATMGGKMYGFIAQEAKDLIPNVVTYYPDEDEPLESGWCSAYSINYAPVTAVLVEAIKELTARLEALEAG